MKKRAIQSMFVDRIHKGFVVVCLGITLYGVGNLGLRWYRYFTVLRPESKARELQQTKSLLVEGSSELLKDNASKMKL